MENFKDWSPGVFCSCCVLLLTWDLRDLKNPCHEFTWPVLCSVDTWGSPDSQVLTVMASDGWGQRARSPFAPFDLIYIGSEVSQVGELSFWAWSLSNVDSLGLGKSPLLRDMETWMTRFGWLHLKSPGKLPAPYLTLCHLVLPLVCWLEYSRVKIETILVGMVRVLTLWEPQRQRLTFWVFQPASLCLWGPVLLAGRDLDGEGALLCRQKSAVGQTQRLNTVASRGNVGEHREAGVMIL